MAFFFLFATISPLSACQSTLPEFLCPARMAGWWLSVVYLLWELACELADLPYWNGYWSFRLCSIPGFCRLKTTGRWLLPCDARVSARVRGTSFGDASARSIVLSVSPCRVPRCVGLAVDTGVKRTSLSTTSSIHPCWLVPCWSHRLDRALKSPHIIIVSPSSSSISSRNSQLDPVMQVEGWMYALMRIRDLCLSSGFFYPDALQFAWACWPLIQVQ